MFFFVYDLSHWCFSVFWFTVFFYQFCESLSVILIHCSFRFCNSLFRFSWLTVLSVSLYRFIDLLSFPVLWFVVSVILIHCSFRFSDSLFWFFNSLFFPVLWVTVSVLWYIVFSCSMIHCFWFSWFTVPFGSVIQCFGYLDSPFFPVLWVTVSVLWFAAPVFLVHCFLFRLCNSLCRLSDLIRCFSSVFCFHFFSVLWFTVSLI